MNPAKNTYRKVTKFFEDSELEVINDDIDLHLLIKQNRTDDLPMFLSPTVFKIVIVKDIRQNWRPECYKLLENVNDLMKEFMVTIAAHWSVFRQKLSQVADIL